MPDGNLAAVPGQDIEPVDADHGNPHHGQDGQDPVAQKERAGENQDNEGNHDPPLHSGVEDGHILSVVFVEGSGA
jgi:hypothetical protein